MSWIDWLVWAYFGLPWLILIPLIFVARYQGISDPDAPKKLLAYDQHTLHQFSGVLLALTNAMIFGFWRSHLHHCRPKFAQIDDPARP